MAARPAPKGRHLRRHIHRRSWAMLRCGAHYPRSCRLADDAGHERPMGKSPAITKHIIAALFPKKCRESRLCLGDCVRELRNAGSRTYLYIRPALAYDAVEYTLKLCVVAFGRRCL